VMSAISMKKFITVLTDKISVEPIPFYEDAFPSGVSDHTSYILVCFLVGSTIKVMNGIRHNSTPQIIILICC
jgi:hypothetical protein